MVNKMVNLNESKSYSISVLIIASLDIVWAIIAMCKFHFTRSWLFLSFGILMELFFIFDYIARLVQAKSKWTFIRHSMFDFIALMSMHPILTFFRIPRIISLTHLPSLIKKTKFWAHIQKYINLASNFLYTNGLIHVLYINFFAIILGSVLEYLLERGITFPTFGDAVWWAFVTVTTVGYGDYVPKTVLGRSIAVILMMVGIGLLSMLTGTIATYFANMRKQKTQVQLDIDSIKNLLNTMDKDEIHSLLVEAEKIKSEENTSEAKNEGSEDPPEKKV